MLASLVLATMAAAVGSPRWTVAHAQRAMLTLRLAGSEPVVYAHCNGTGRRRRTVGAVTYSRFRCSVAAASRAAANIDIQVVSATRYRILDCETASAPLAKQVCPGPVPAAPGDPSACTAPALVTSCLTAAVKYDLAKRYSDSYGTPPDRMTVTLVGCNPVPSRFECDFVVSSPFDGSHTVRGGHVVDVFAPATPGYRLVSSTITNPTCTRSGTAC